LLPSHKPKPDFINQTEGAMQTGMSLPGSSTSALLAGF